MTRLRGGAAGAGARGSAGLGRSQVGRGHGQGRGRAAELSATGLQKLATRASFPRGPYLPVLFSI